LFKKWNEKYVGRSLPGRQRRILLSGLLCLLLAGIYTGVSTVAWFNQEISSKNELKIGIFSTNATLIDPSVSTFSLRGRGAALGASASEVQPGFYRLNVEAVGNSSGYCLIYLKATTSDFPQAVYYSDQLGRSGEASYGYDLLINEPTSIRVVPVWRDMEGADPLRNDEYISYGRPPVVVKPEEEEEQTGTEGEGSSESSAPAAGSSESSAPATGGSESSAPATGGSESSAPAAGGSESSAPAAGSSESSAPATGGSESSTPAAGGSESSTPATGGSESNIPATGGSESSTPAAGGSESSAPATGGSESSTPTTGSSESNTPAAGGSESSAPAESGTTESNV